MTPFTRLVCMTYFVERRLTVILIYYSGGSFLRLPCPLLGQSHSSWKKFWPTSTSIFCSNGLFSSGRSFPLDSIGRSTHHITTMKVETLIRRGWRSVHALASWTELCLEASRIEFYQLLSLNHGLISNWNQEKCNNIIFLASMGGGLLLQRGC